jgi:predicted outer membrane repeat protein
MNNALTRIARLAVPAAVAPAIAALVAVGAVSIERAFAAPALTVLTVTNANDSGTGSLRQAIADANATPGADTIRITVSGTVHILSTLHITDEVAILGPGAGQFALDSGGNVPVFEIGYFVLDSGGNPKDVPVPVSIADLTVQHGNAGDGYGGGIHSTSALALTNVNVVNNLALLRGGGADVAGAVVLNGGRFEGNISKEGEGGALFAFSTVALTGTQFISNSAILNGGGVAAVGPVTANGGRFENNQCVPPLSSMHCNGGGLMTFRSNLIGTQFVNNVTKGDGGGAWLYGPAQVNSGRFKNHSEHPARGAIHR